MKKSEKATFTSASLVSNTAGQVKARYLQRRLNSGKLKPKQYVYKIPEVEYFAAMHALGIIETAGEAIFGALHMYALQTTQTSTSPKARGIIVYFYDHAISVVGNSQDKLTVYLGNKGIEDPHLKSLVTKATDALLQSKYALQEIQNDIKKGPYVYPKD